MINWDMSHLLDVNSRGLYNPKIGSINDLFYGCKNLKIIKMSSNFSDITKMISDCRNHQIFKDVPPGGTFYWKKGVNCDKLLSQLPVSWNRVME